MVLSTLADGVTRSVEGMTGTVSGLFFEPTIRIGVTGLSRAGKTVFITSLIANLLDRGRMPQLAAAANGSIKSAYLQPQPDDTVPRFDYEDHLASMTGKDPVWPEGTRTVSELRLSLRIQPRGLIGALSGPRTVHLDIIDYPGEWLLDLGLLDKSYDEWAREALAKAAERPQGAAYAQQAADVDPDQPFDDPAANALARGYSAYLRAARKAGYSDCTPGRFLLPGSLEGSPALTFAPLPPGGGRRSLGREMARRYEAYKSKIIRPFFRDHFARIDRQVVLVDVLGALHQGPRAVQDLHQTMADILAAFRPGRNAFLSQLFMGRRVDKILFCATKADHLHHEQHPQLTAIMEALTRDARDRAQFSGAETGALSLAALRTTVEDEVDHKGERIAAVRGKLLETGNQAAFFPGTLPDDPNEVLNAAREAAPDGDTGWPFGAIQAARFAPAEQKRAPGQGPAHIRLDRAAEFLIGDRLR